MNIIEAIVLGIIQGLTEFIPISSSGHLVIAQYFMTGASDHLFLEWINLGTVVALIIFFHARIAGMIRDVAGGDYKLAANIVGAAVPAGVVGFFAADFIERNSFFGNIWVVVVMLAAVGVLLVLLERLPHLSSVDTENLPFKRAITIGIAQVCALIPGTSRSGSTIIAGRIMGLSRANAAEFSFLLSIPIMLGVIAKLLVKSSDRAYLLQHLDILVVGNIAALVSGLVAVKFLMSFLQKHTLKAFGWYRIGLAVAISVLLLLK